MLIPIDKDLLFSRQDPADPRLGDIVKCGALIDLAQSKQSKNPPVALMGYPDDSGIKLNGGRIGASLAPTRIRNFLYRMTPPAFLDLSQENPDVFFPVFDLGDVDAGRTGTLGDRHDFARETVRKVLKTGARLITLGGGHDYGFPDAAAYCEQAIAKGQRPLVINYDAHLDVRPTDRGLTSGTPFYRLLEEFPEIDFIELGLQGQCNSRAHLRWVQDRGGLVSFEESRALEGLSLTGTLQRFLGEAALRRRSAFLSIDIDAFSSSVAPGASQSWPTGFLPADFFDSFSWCLNRLDVQSIGIYEVSPPLDIDDRTSRLAALIAHRFMFQL
ncbi:MAG: formimidoylglutamase [Bdellovibrionales bacterium]|jgi:formiminoglutamase|nr:formimidoylglutamase [Bdellovibrionales bacterium]